MLLKLDLILKIEEERYLFHQVLQNHVTQVHLDLSLLKLVVQPLVLALNHVSC